jgi:stage III sporulation protein AG
VKAYLRREDKMKFIHKAVDIVKALLDGKDRKKLVESALMVLIAGIIIVLAGSMFLDNGENSGKDVKKNAAVPEAMEAASRNVEKDDSGDIAREIGRVLSEIEGAGKVTVMITYVSGEEIVPAQDIRKIQNNTQERDSGGGTRTISEDEYESSIVFVDGEGGNKKPIILKTKMPEVKGVVIVAEGAGDSVVKENLVRAAQVLMDVPVHKIQVFKKSK